MIFRDNEDVYIKIPRTAASIIVRSIIQANLSMKLDNSSSEESLSASEFSLLQLANMLGNANPFESHNQIVDMKRGFDPTFLRDDGTRPEGPADMDESNVG